jgi:AbrB family looped-hinge helix DNA binding protein
MPNATLTSKGQTTIPKEVRNFLKLRPGDRLEFILHENGTVILKPATLNISDLKGILHRPGMKPVSVSAMNSAIRRRFRVKR